MSRLERRIILFAIFFVIVYVGAIVITVRSRMEMRDRETHIESALPVSKEEAPLMLAELLLPMAVLFTLAVCFIVAKKKREKVYRRLGNAEPRPEEEKES